MSEDSSSIKIVQLTTGVVGGAGLAARRLNQSLNSNGVNSTLWSLESPSFIPNINEFAIHRSIADKIGAAKNSLVSRLATQDVLMSPLSMSPRCLRKKIVSDQFQGSILHIHNWFNLLSIEDFYSLAERKVPMVFTLHDQRFFTGACHYSISCQNFKNGCKVCPQTSRPFQLFARLSDTDVRKLRLVAEKSIFLSPSNWLIELAKSSPVLRDADLRLIKNSFFGLPGIVEREASSRDQLSIGVASMSPNSWIKGGALVQELLDPELRENEKFNIVSLSNYADPGVGNIKFWSQIDILLVPSRLDNSPNVIHEAHRHGIPVIAAKVGGIDELLIPGFDYGMPLENLTRRNLTDLFKRDRARILALSTGRRKSDQVQSEEMLIKEYSSVYLDASIQSNI